ncbi:hypothetical protein [Nannocystis pusilla]|uniref:hypothetical protein n=1 Tax=Nannocystis pusilla TaxID=889268 RepID=UPI003DA5EEB5
MLRPKDCDPNGVPDLCRATIDECDFTMGAGETFSSETGPPVAAVSSRGAVATSPEKEPDLPAAFDCPGETPLAATNRLRLFGEDYIKHGRVESICAPSYGKFFKETAAQVAALCDQFIPQ